MRHVLGLRSSFSLRMSRCLHIESKTSYRDPRSTTTQSNSDLRPNYPRHPLPHLKPSIPHPTHPTNKTPHPVTGPVARFARQIASQGYIVAAPSSYHEFIPADPLAYDVPGTDLGNDLKVKKKVSAYDEDATLTVDHLLSLPTCTGRIGATGMCLGGHLAYRAALDKRVNATVCYFATDIHSGTLGEGMRDDSLGRTGEIGGEVVMVSPSVLCLLHFRCWCW